MRPSGSGVLLVADAGSLALEVAQMVAELRSAARFQAVPVLMRQIVDRVGRSCSQRTVGDDR